MHSTTGAEISPKEMEILALAKTANGPWFDVVLKAAGIQADRRKKYSGGRDPYINFTIVGTLIRLKYPDIPDEDVFYFYQCIKFARLIISAGDFDDESLEDTLIDLGVYSFLEAGFRCRNSILNAQEQDLQMTFPSPTA